MVNILARHSSFLRHVCGIDLSSVCLFVCLFVFLGIQGSQWKELLAHVCQSVCLVSCAIICASEANPAEDLMGSFHSLFFSLG